MHVAAPERNLSTWLERLRRRLLCYFLIFIGVSRLPDSLAESENVRRRFAFPNFLIRDVLPFFLKEGLQRWAN